jgi:hypothetical protein
MAADRSSILLCLSSPLLSVVEVVSGVCVTDGPSFYACFAWLGVSVVVCLARGECSGLAGRPMSSCCTVLSSAWLGFLRLLKERCF